MKTNIGVPLGGFLTGDIFDKAQFNFFDNLGKKDDTILLTINGVMTNDVDAQKMLNSIKTWAVGPNAKFAIQNGTHGLLGIKGTGDLAQVGLNEIGKRDLVAIRAAIQIELAAGALRRNNVKNPTIVVVAHSQGCSRSCIGDYAAF
jgi:hypothetical protein